MITRGIGTSIVIPGRLLGVHADWRVSIKRYASPDFVKMQDAYRTYILQTQIPPRVVVLIAALDVLCISVFTLKKPHECIRSISSLSLGVLGCIITKLMWSRTLRKYADDTPVTWSLYWHTHIWCCPPTKYVGAASLLYFPTPTFFNWPKTCKCSL